MRAFPKKTALNILQQKNLNFNLPAVSFNNNNNNNNNNDNNNNDNNDNNNNNNNDNNSNETYI